MRIIVLIVFFIPIFLFAQEKDSNLDSLPSFFLKDFIVKEELSKEALQEYNYMKWAVSKYYPYAKYVQELLIEMDTELATIDKKRKKKKYIKSTNKKLDEQFSKMVKNMSEKQGDVLCKLIHRQTGNSVYEIITKYRSKSKAFLWQSIAWAGGADLKQTFNPDKDVLIDYLTKQIENGKILVKELSVQ